MINKKNGMDLRTVLPTIIYMCSVIVADKPGQSGLICTPIYQPVVRVMHRLLCLNYKAAGGCPQQNVFL